MPPIGRPAVIKASDFLAHAPAGSILSLPEEMKPFDFGGRAVADRKLAIAEALAPYDAIQTIAVVALPANFSPPEGYSESRSDPAARLEYIASVLLQREQPQGLRVETVGQTTRAGQAVQRAIQIADEILLCTIFHVMDKAQSAASPPLAQIAARLQLREAVVRGPGYERQGRDLMRQFFADEATARVLRETLGFDIDQLLTIDESLGSLLQRRFNAELETIALLAGEEPELAYQVHRRAEHILCVTASELAAESGLAETVVAAFLRAFSTSFGEGTNLHLLSALAPIRLRPLIDAGDARYLVTSAVNLLWAIPPILEAALRDTDVWESYQARRAEVIEAWSVDSLAEAVRADYSAKNLRFSVGEDAARYEVDGLVLLDDFAFVVEAKSGRLSDNARRGRARDLVPALEALVGRASSQALRLVRAIRDREAIHFYSDGGDEIDVPLQSVTRAQAVIATVEDLSWLVTFRSQLAELGLLNAEDPMPWLATVFDLQIVAQMLEFPAQITLYLRDRLSLDSRVVEGDEMNLWMIHWLHCLRFEPEANRIMLRGDWTAEIDRYFMFGEGRLPKMPLDRAVRREVERLDRRRVAGHIAASEEVIAADQARRPPTPTVRATRAGRIIVAYGRDEDPRSARLTNNAE